MKRIAVLAALMGISISVALAQQQGNDYGDFSQRNRGRQSSSRSNSQYLDAIKKTAGMTNDQIAQRLAADRGLNILNITWEDTGRFKGSSVGPNISDMTIQVDPPTTGGRSERNPYANRYEPKLMPVFRLPNFSDVTGELDPDTITLLVGNESGESLERISLTDYLSNIGDYLKPGRGHVDSLIANRDSKVLVSAQACFLPVPFSGLATFNPVLFNYQSSPAEPAVLTILATPEGTSSAVIENFRTGTESWGQKLFFNHNGQKAALTGQRMSDHLRLTDPNQPQIVPDTALNMVMLIQVPLIYHRNDFAAEDSSGKVLAAPSMGSSKAMHHTRSNVENAVIGHGSDKGPFVDLDGLTIQRDPNFPIRMTVQFYKATSNGVVDEQDVDQIKSDIDKVYSHSDVVSSLVTGGETGRVTDYVGCKVQAEDWWDNFWLHYETETGQSRQSAIAKLRRLLGEDYRRRPVSRLYLHDILRQRKD